MRSSSELIFNLFLILALIAVIVLTTGCASHSAAAADASTRRLFGYDLHQTRSVSNQTYLTYADQQRSISSQLISGLDEDIAQELVSEKVTLFKSIFEPKRADYPGQYTTNIVCPDEFKPQLHSVNTSTSWFWYFDGYANANKVAGACAQDLIKYRQIYGFLYCQKQHALIELEYDLAYNGSASNAHEASLFVKNVTCDGI